MRTEWRGFKGNKWQSEVNLRDFIQNNYTSYDGDETFLAEPTQATDTLWGMLKELQKQERAKGGVLDMESKEKREAEKQRRYDLKQQKRKEKHRGR